MKFWHAMGGVPLDRHCEIGLTMEQLGFTGATFDDHLVTPSVMASPYPYTQDRKIFWDPSSMFPDPWQAISVMASATSRLLFTTSIYVLPLRDVFTVAKAVSTAAVISGNRIILGFGVGWMAEEFALTGQDFKNRGARADEMIDVIRAFMKGGMVEYHGKYLDFPPVQMAPVPCQDVPIVIGGESDAALRRAARCNGWLAPMKRPEEFDGLLRRFSEAQKAVERPNEPARIIAAVNDAVEADECRRLAELGVTDVILRNRNRSDRANVSIDMDKRALEVVAERVIRHF